MMTATFTIRLKKRFNNLKNRKETRYGR